MRIDPEVVWSHGADGTHVLLLPPNTCEVLFLEGTARDIWLEVAAGRDFVDIVALMVDKYVDVSRSQIDDGVADFVAQLAGMGVLAKGE